MSCMYESSCMQWGRPPGAVMAAQRISCWIVFHCFLFWVATAISDQKMKRRCFTSATIRGLYLESPENLSIFNVLVLKSWPISFFIEKNLEECKVYWLRSSTFWRYQGNCGTWNRPKKFQDFRETSHCSLHCFFGKFFRHF